MTRRMAKDEARAWVERWKLVEDRERRELRKETYAERLRALAVLMASHDLFDLSALDEEDVRVRARWAELQSLAPHADG